MILNLEDVKALGGTTPKAARSCPSGRWQREAAREAVGGVWLTNP